MTNTKRKLLSKSNTVQKRKRINPKPQKRYIKDLPPPYQGQKRPNQELQENLILLLCFDTERAQEIKSRVKIGLFESLYREIADRVFGYLHKHGKAPGHANLEHLFADVPDKKKKQLSRAFRRMAEEYQGEWFNPDYVMDELDNFIRHQGLLAATKDVMEQFTSSSPDSPAVAVTNKRVIEIFREAVTTYRKQSGGRLASTIPPRDPSFLWWPYLVAGEINTLGGAGNIGKGVMLASVAAHITKKREWPDRSGKASKGNVLWAEAEDSLETTVVPRLIASEANLDRVTFFNQSEFRDLDLASFVRENDVRLVVLSPLNAFLRRVKNTNDEMTVRDELTRLHEAVQNTECAVAAIMHLNKKTDLDAIERLLGSVAFANYVRSVLLINFDPDVPNLRRVIHAKHNLSPKGSDLCFEIDGEDPKSQFIEARWHAPDGQNVVVDSFLDRRKSNNQKLSNSDLKKITKLLNLGDLTHKQIADQFGVARSRISQIARELREEE